MGRKVLNDLVGEEFGYLVALNVDHVHKRYGAFWKCLCKICGNEKHVVSRSNLINGCASSCGCRKGQSKRIANLTGCSQSVVSTVLRNRYERRGHTTKEKTAKIRKLAKKFNYTPWYNLTT